MFWFLSAMRTKLIKITTVCVFLWGKVAMNMPYPVAHAAPNHCRPSIRYSRVHQPLWDTREGPALLLPSPDLIIALWRKM